MRYALKGATAKRRAFHPVDLVGSTEFFFFGIVLFQDEPNCTLSNPRKLSDFALDVFYSSKNCI